MTGTRRRSRLLVVSGAVVVTGVVATLGTLAASAATSSGRSPAAAHVLGVPVYVGAGPVAVAIDSTRHEAFVASVLNQRVTVVSTASVPLKGQTSPHRQLNSKPRSIAVDAKDHVVVVPLAAAVKEAAVPKILFLDESSIMSQGAPGSQLLTGIPEGNIALDPKTGLAVVPGYGTQTAVTIDAKTQTITSPVYRYVPRSSELTPLALSVDVDSATGEQYLADGREPYLFVGPEAPTAGRQSTSPFQTIPLPSYPLDVAVDPAAGVQWVTFPPLGEIAEIKGGAVVATFAAGPNPDYLAVDPQAGMLYVTDSQDDEVYVIRESDGSIVATVPVGSNPTAIAVDPVLHVAVVANSGAASVTLIAGPGYTGVAPAVAASPGTTPTGETSATPSGEGISTSPTVSPSPTSTGSTPTGSTAPSTTSPSSSPSGSSSGPTVASASEGPPTPATPVAPGTAGGSDPPATDSSSSGRQTVGP